MSMVDLSEFEALGVKAAFEQKLSRLSAEERAKLDAALDADHISTAAIQRWLEQHGVEVGHSTIHRRRG